MTQRDRETDAPLWLGQEPARQGESDGALWIGRHAADQDILVFDPSEADPAANVLSFYSLTQHRTRSFPRAMAAERILALTDELGCARAKKDYAQRDSLRATHEEALAAARTERTDRHRDGVIDAHRRYLEGLGLAYQGVRESGVGRRGRHRTKCHGCGLALDDFAGKVCGGCDGVLCSCGACACKATGPKPS